MKPATLSEDRHTVTRLATRRHFLGSAAVGALGLCLGGCYDPPPDEPTAQPDPLPEGVQSKEAWRSASEASLARGAEWLWDQQRKNGAFASRTYQSLRDGQSLTPLSLLALLQVHPDVREFQLYQARDALFQMIKMQNADGALGFWEATEPDYPCYATGMFLTVLGVLKPQEWAEASAPSVHWLRGQQFRKADGWTGHPAQGGWGLGSQEKRLPPSSGRVDLSITRAVLEGLRSVGLPTDDPTLIEAGDFVLRCQRDDGSFLHSPTDAALNKSATDFAGNPKGYGSATADGILSLLALGGRPADPALAAARSWLHLHHRTDRNPGLEGSPMEKYAEAMRFYYRAAAAESFMLTGGPGSWQSELGSALAAEQQADGSWRNESTLQKEDDPIVATSFAIRALAALLR